MERIASGLQRKTLSKCSDWACRYRIMSKPFAGPWTFKHHPWLKEMHDSSAEMNVGQKAAQMGFTEWAMNRTFFKIDVEGIDCLYILPTDSDASDFSAGRFNPALEESPHLQKLFSDVKNVGHKRAGSNNLYVRGSRSRSQLKSIPTGFIVFDEVEEMMQNNIPLAMERASGQLSVQILMISTPTIEDVGINKEFKLTTQEHFFFKCLGCNRLTELVFPDCLVMTADSVTDQNLQFSFYKCKECGKIINREDKWKWLESGIFVPEHSDRDARGFHVPQLYSSATLAAAPNIAKMVLQAETDPTVEQELWNSKLGLPHAVKGAKVTDDDIQRCIGTYAKPPNFIGQNIITMGVDVGKVLHYEVDLWTLPEHRTPGLEINDESKPYLLTEGEVRSFEQLDHLLTKFNVRFTVVDRQPETREAYKFACRHWGRVYLCLYGKGVDGKQIQVGTEEEAMITVNRTSWLDLSLGRFRSQSIILPMDLSPEYKKHIKNPTRVYERDKNGNPVGRYVNTDDDHFAHARNYAEIALVFAIGCGTTQTISKVL